MKVLMFFVTVIVGFSSWAETTPQTKKVPSTEKEKSLNLRPNSEIPESAKESGITSLQDPKAKMLQNAESVCKDTLDLKGQPKVECHRSLYESDKKKK
jgi:hypothetical protein